MPLTSPQPDPAAATRRGRLTRAARLWFRALRYRWKLNPQQIRAMRACLPRGGIALDVGAHKGAYSCLMAWRLGPTGRVLAFEPQDRLISDTREALAALGLRQVKLIHAAVSDRSGEDTIAIRRSSTHGASMEGLDGDDISLQALTLVTLDEIVARERLERIDFIKIDVEGHELAVLRGARDLLARFHPPLLIEIEARHQSTDDPLAMVRAILEPLGYKGYFFSRAGRQPIETFSYQAHQNQNARDSGGIYCNDFLFLCAEPRANTPAR